MKRYVILAAVVVLGLVLGCAEKKEDAYTYFIQARNYRSIWYGTYMSLMDLEKKTYGLYKEVFKENKELMTHKDIAEMYALGARHEEDSKFLETLRKVYEREVKSLN